MYELELSTREYFSRQVGVFIFYLFIQNKFNQFAFLILEKLKLLLPIKYISLGKAKNVETILLAFTIPNNLPPVKVEGFTLYWTKDALANFSKVHEDLKKIKNLPYASLRGLLEVKLPNVSRIEASMCLSRYTISQQKSQPFAYIDGGNEHQITQALKPILNDWLENYLVPYCQKEGVSDDTIERLRELQQENKLSSITSFQAQIFPWLQHKESGTAEPPHKFYSFPALADYLARLVAGHEIFQGLGGVKRIITSKFGSYVELITDKILLDDKGLFSLVVNLEIKTSNSNSQPEIKLDISKRRWLKTIKEDSFDSNSINGYVFSKNHSDRVFNFTLNRRKNLNTNQWEWQPDSAFNVLQRELNLPLHISNAKQIVKGEASTDDCQVLLTYRDGLEGKHDIKAGVPEKDKLEAFKAIAEILELQGIKPFDGYTKVKFPKGKGHYNDISASRTINTPTLFSSILENKDIPERDKKSLTRMSNLEINNVLKETFDFELSEKGINNLQFNSKNKHQIQELGQLIKANQDAIKRLYPHEKPLVIIFHENGYEKTVEILKAVINMLWKDALEIQIQRLPANTHGAKVKLPGNNLKNKERSQLRVDAWNPIAQQIANIKRPKFCLVMARDFYPSHEDSDKQLHDDTVNKTSTRKALASIGRSCVQFILPPQIWLTSGDLHISDFILRAQASIKDLIWAHSGRIDNIKEKVNQWFGDIQLKDRPKEIIAITIDRKNAGRARRLENTFLPIAIKTNVETGLSEMCCCYEDSKTKKFVITSWQPFTEALFDIANISPISLGKEENVRKQRFEEFVEQIISNSVKDGKNPVVTIDSSNCVKLWNWLSDSNMNLSNIYINGHTYMQVNWKGARIVRVRQDIAPGIIEDKVKYLAETFLDDTRNLEELKADKDKQITISAPSGQITGLYKLNVKTKTNCISYLSVGQKTLHKNQRGASCYKEVEQDKFLTLKEIDENGSSSYKRVKNKAGLEIKILEKQEPYTDQWATPNPLEIVVTLRQEPGQTHLVNKTEFNQPY